MRLYLSSYGFGDTPQDMLPLVRGVKRTAVIMNALDGKRPDSRAERLQREIDGLSGLGLHPEELDLRDYFGKEIELAEDIKKYDYIWARGGNVFLLRRAYRQSGFDHILTKLLRDDAVAYGGFSAGICILAPSLHGIELVDPTDEVAAGYEPEVIWGGLGVLDYAIAPHYRSDHPESADVEKLVAYYHDNNIPFKALRDGEAICINEE